MKGLVLGLLVLAVCLCGFVGAAPPYTAPGGGATGAAYGAGASGTAYTAPAAPAGTVVKTYGGGAASGVNYGAGARVRHVHGGGGVVIRRHHHHHHNHGLRRLGFYGSGFYGGANVVNIAGVLYEVRWVNGRRVFVRLSGYGAGGLGLDPHCVGGSVYGGVVLGY